VSERETRNVSAVRAFFAALSNGAAPEVVAAFYASDAIQEEFPNQFLPQGARRDLKALREAGERGRKVMSAQTFDILSVLAQDNAVVVEAAWSGTLAIPLGEKLPAGSVMRARFAQFFEFRDGKIVAQRNYDCFYPF
jgi:ketosteroid isomerase-like protein